MTFLPIPNGDNDDDDDERDRILDAHDILVAGRMEREGDERVLTHEHEEAELPSLLQRGEILAE